MLKVLILENDWLILSFLKSYLENKGFEVNCVQSISRAENLLKSKCFDLLLCERIMADGDVFDLLERIRDKNIFMKVMLFSRKKSLRDRIKALSLANDFLAKPFNFTELSLKIDNLLKLEKIDQNLIVEDSFLLKDSAVLNYNNHFRPQELKILECLNRYKNMIVTYEMISSYVWGCKEPLPTKKTISVYIRRIRIKINIKKIKIITIKGRGYRLIYL